MNKNKRTAIPKLRLRQFEDKPQWDICKLGKIVIPVEERAGAKKYTLMSVTSGVGLVPQVEKFGREIAGSAYKNYYVIKKNDFAYNKSATKQFPEGYISMLTDYTEAALPNSIFTCFRIVDEECDPRFFDHLFHNNYHGTWLRKYIEVGARAHGSLSVDTKHLWNMPIALPKLEEQQKIADCLSSINDLISAEDKKLSALKDHKKGLMQKLFPAEGKTVPEWRFPEFRGCKEWEEKILSDVGQIITGKTPSTADSTLWNGDIQFVTPTDIDDAKYQLKTQRTVALNNKMNILPPKSIMFTCIASIGKIALSIFPCITNQQINSVIPHSKYNNEFIYYALYKKAYYIKLQLASTTLPIVNKTDFSKFIITIPKNPEEQQKIVDVLSSVDELITAQSEKIESLKQHKKGLLQGLFPSIEEVSQ